MLATSPSSQVIQSLEKQGIDYQIVDSTRSELFRSEVVRKYGTSNERPLWEGMYAAAIQDPNGWEKIDDFLSRAGFIMFFDKQDDSRVIEIDEGCSVTLLLADCFGFVFYITNTTLDYLLCYNDHDFLIGAGTADMWIRTLKF